MEGVPGRDGGLLLIPNLVDDSARHRVDKVERALHVADQGRVSIRCPNGPEGQDVSPRLVVVAAGGEQGKVALLLELLLGRPLARLLLPAAAVSRAPDPDCVVEAGGKQPPRSVGAEEARLQREAVSRAAVGTASAALSPTWQLLACSRTEIGSGFLCPPRRPARMSNIWTVPCLSEDAMASSLIQQDTDQEMEKAPQRLVVGCDPAILHSSRTSPPLARGARC